MNMPDIPSGLTEAEEAQWHFDHQDEFAEAYLASPESRNPQRGYTARKFGLTSQIDINAQDTEIARILAAEAGMHQDEYAAQVLHEALQNLQHRRAS